ncbi:MAG: restriction endonuclease [Burkholderiaceae bacterium]
MSAKPSHRPDPTLRERAAAVPWWAWIGAAVLSHVALRLVEGSEATVALQYVVPALFVAAAVVGLRLRRAVGTAPGHVSTAPHVDSMRWREFEALVGRAFELQGFHMNESGAAGSDAGIDLLMRKERQTHLVHCRPWRAEKVGIESVHAARAAMQARGAVGGFVLSSGRFSREATAAAGSYNIRLVDGPALQALLQQGRAQAARSERAEGTDTEPAALELPRAAAPVASLRAVAPAEVSAEPALPCALCGGDMKKRLAKRGVNAGQYFWGCVRHPECRGTRRVRPA